MLRSFAGSFGAAPTVLGLLALAAWAFIAATRSAPVAAGVEPLVPYTHSKEHVESYQPTIDAFTARTGVPVRCLVLDHSAPGSRLRATLESGAPGPDLVELTVVTASFLPSTIGLVAATLTGTMTTIRCQPSPSPSRGTSPGRTVNGIQTYRLLPMSCSNQRSPT